jgi:hypothetical protein
MTIKRDNGNESLEKMLNNIEIDSSSLDIQVYLNVKFEEHMLHKAVCIYDYNWNEQLYVVQLCDHSNCGCVLGFIAGYNTVDFKVNLQVKLAWVLESDSMCKSVEQTNSSNCKRGSYLSSSGISGIMKLSSNPTKFRLGIDTVEQDDVIRQIVTGYDRSGILYVPELGDDCKAIVDRYPKVQYIKTDGSLQQEYIYYQDKKRCESVKKLDLSPIERMKQKDSKVCGGDRISRLTRPTALTSNRHLPTLTRRDSTSSISSMRGTIHCGAMVGNTNLTRRDSKTNVNPPMIERSIFKVSLYPIF